MFDVTLSADALSRKGDGPPSEPQARDNAMRVHEYCAEMRAFACLVDFGALEAHARLGNRSP
jgi:hypothetical protein